MGVGTGFDYKKAYKRTQKFTRASEGVKDIRFGANLGRFKQVLGALGFGAGGGGGTDSVSESEERARAALGTAAIGQREGAAGASSAMEQDFAMSGGNIKDPAQRALLQKSQQTRRVGTEHSIGEQRVGLEVGFMQNRNIEMDRALRERLAMLQIGTSLWGQFTR